MIQKGFYLLFNCGFRTTKLKHDRTLSYMHALSDIKHGTPLLTHLVKA